MLTSGLVPCSCTQRFLTSTMQNLSTQSMLMALGLGAKRTVAASAAINWLLKDGVGRIARMTVATQFCQSFDSDLKVWCEGLGVLPVGWL